MGEAAEGKIATHNNKKLKEAATVQFAHRFDIPISDEDAKKRRSTARRRFAGNEIPQRTPRRPRRLRCRSADAMRRRSKRRLKEILKSSTPVRTDKRRSTTKAFGNLLRTCCATRKSASSSCRLSPTKRALSAWTACSALTASILRVGQLYEPVDRKELAYYKEPRRPDSGRRHQRSRRDVEFHRGGHGLRHPRRATRFRSTSTIRCSASSAWATSSGWPPTFARAASCSAARRAAPRLNGEGLQHQDGHSATVGLRDPEPGRL